MHVQIAAAHHDLNNLILATQDHPDQLNALARRLDDMHNDGWHALVHTLRLRFGLPAEPIGTATLDNEDHAILALLDYAQSQPDEFAALAAQSADANTQHAAHALAALIYAATQGEHEALEALAELHQAADTPEALAASAAFIRMIEGERQPDVLCRDLPNQQAALIQAVLASLEDLEN